MCVSAFRISLAKVKRVWIAASLGTVLLLQAGCQSYFDAVSEATGRLVVEAVCEAARPMFEVTLRVLEAALYVGMSMAEVRQELGEPESIQTDPESDHQGVVWIYPLAESEDAVCQVRFDRSGSLIGWSTAPRRS